MLTVLGCTLAFEGCSDGAADQEAAWEEARAAYRAGDPRAFFLWQILDSNTIEGAEAHSRLERAEAYYRDGIQRLETGESGAREALARGVSIAPMDPHHYLRLARACRDQGLTLRAAEYYTKYLRAFPPGSGADVDLPLVREELEALDPSLSGVFRDPPAEEESDSWILLLTGGALGSLLSLVALLIAQWFSRRGVRLEQLLAESPEFHPSVAYLVGSLRHELLKHRVAAAGDALRSKSQKERSFLLKRLYAGTPLRDTWEAHLQSFEQALGHRVVLRRNELFRNADRAVGIVERVRGGVERGESGAIEKLSSAHEDLMCLDAYLAELLGTLTRTTIDESLLQEIVLEVQSEPSAGAVELGPISVTVMESEDPILVDVFRVDLVLILKNILRNAIFAVDGQAKPSVALSVELELEPTGEENVHLSVFDSSDESFDRELLFDRRVDRGLGLVGAAVRRYGGTLNLGTSAAPFKKVVKVTFFRAY